MTITKVLFVEDEKQPAETVADYLHSKGGFTCGITNFPKALEIIRTDPPDVIVLDIWVKGTAQEPVSAGVDILNSIWKEHYCPIVVFSANPELPDEYANHPFVQCVTKGKVSTEELGAAIEALKPQIAALQAADQDIQSAFAFSLRVVAPIAFSIFPDSEDSEERMDMIVRTGRRRLAALMDDVSRDGQTLASWEMYLCPPVSNDLQLGDILHIKGAPTDDAQSYYIVLTPSCDLVASGGREAKVESVLLSHCCPVRQGLKLVNRHQMKLRELKSFLPREILSQGYFKSLIPLPGLEGRLPPMFANLKDLHLISLKRILREGSKFSIVASIDSPFRELVAWAYMQVACRPGLPGRDLGPWTGEILRELSENNEEPAKS